MTGRESPLTLKTELFVVASVTVTLAPVAVNVPPAVPLVPTTTLPRGSVAVGVTVSCPVAATPVPDKGTVRVGFGAFEVIVTVPLALPADGGANVTLKVVPCPAVSATGVVIPLRLKPVPEIPT